MNKCTFGNCKRVEFKDGLCENHTPRQDNPKSLGRGGSIHGETGEITIRIYPACDGGYMYDVYDFDVQNITEEINANSFDGGLCTSASLKDALGMAMESAEALIKQLNHDEGIEAAEDEE